MRFDLSQGDPEARALDALLTTGVLSSEGGELVSLTDTTWTGRGHDVTVYNLGIRADTSELVAERWQAECRARLKPSFACATVFAIGINDSAHEKSEAMDGRRIELARSLGYNYVVAGAVIPGYKRYCVKNDAVPASQYVFMKRGNRLVDFHKQPTEAHDYYGEWIGFLKLSPAMAARVPGATKRYIDDGRDHPLYEVAIRDLVLADREGAFGVEDVTGLPWIEIDFMEDVARAEAEILPRLLESA